MREYDLTLEIDYYGDEDIEFYYLKQRNLVYQNARKLFNFIWKI